jgi:hypothetical protein
VATGNRDDSVLVRLAHVEDLERVAASRRDFASSTLTVGNAGEVAFVSSPRVPQNSS